MCGKTVSHYALSIPVPHRRLQVIKTMNSRWFFRKNQGFTVITPKGLDKNVSSEEKMMNFPIFGNPFFFPEGSKKSAGSSGAFLLLFHFTKGVQRPHTEGDTPYDVLLRHTAYGGAAGIH